MPRPMRPLWAGSRLVGPALLILLASAGCTPASLDSNASNPVVPLTLLSAPIVGDGPTLAEVEPNDEFASANVLAIGQTGDVTVDATLSGSQDVDVFDTGTASAGDELVVTVRLPSGMSLAIGVFNGQGDILQYYTQISGSTPVYFETVCRAATNNLYVVASSAIGDATQGGYSLDIQRRITAVPAAGTQVIVLDFDGDPAVSIGGGPVVVVPVFDAARIRSKFAGQTELICQKTLEGVRAAYAGLGVTVRSTDELGAQNGEHSTVYFGTYNPELLGLADSVDSYNQDASQSAIIFTDTFSLFNPLDPSLDEIAQVLANVAAHETGHLLGLWHTVDPQDLMDITATARQMLRPQSFKHAKLHTTVAPIGWQDEPSLLAWAVGGYLKVDTSNQRVVPRVDDDWRSNLDFEVDRRLLSVSFKR